MNSMQRIKINRSSDKSLAFSQKDGFYELPYLVNSPYEMVESFKKMPSVLVDEKKQCISTKTPVLNALVYYRNIEKGLFLIYSEVKFRSNIHFRHFVDKKTPSDYFCLSLRIDHYSKATNSLANGISYTDNSWLIFKPGAKVDHYHFKGTRGRYISLYFTKSWLKNNYSTLPPGGKKLINLFLDSSNDHLICPEFAEKGVCRYNPDNLSKLLFSGENMGKSHFARLKKQTQEFFSSFILKMQSERIDERHFDVSNLERIKTVKAEKIIGSHVRNKFPGIEFISNEVGLSGTKLKESFKKVYGESIFQYFRSRQMEEARSIIASTTLPLVRIATEFGYANAGKFATAFKAAHRLLPSQIKRAAGVK
jgi:AraC-like DNA-binding protein